MTYPEIGMWSKMIKSDGKNKLKNLSEETSISFFFYVSIAPSLSFYLIFSYWTRDFLVAAGSGRLLVIPKDKDAHID